MRAVDRERVRYFHSSLRVARLVAEQSARIVAECEEALARAVCPLREGDRVSITVLTFDPCRDEAGKHGAASATVESVRLGWAFKKGAEPEPTWSVLVRDDGGRAHLRGPKSDLRLLEELEEVG